MRSVLYVAKQVTVAVIIVTAEVVG